MRDILPEVIAKVMALEPEKRRTLPLRLDVAARIAFPDGTMGAPGLRKERDKGRLVTEMIAGKEYTSLVNIERMRELCRVQPKAGKSKTEEGELALAAARAKLLKRKTEAS
jgi:hypothetical protein